MPRTLPRGAEIASGLARCDGCLMTKINGVAVHEHDCPDAWKTEARFCPNCGNPFLPEHRRSNFCTLSCYAAYNGMYYEEDD